jgi:hypothetical protein
MPARSRSFDSRVTESGTYWSSLGPTLVTRTMQVGAWGTNDDFIGNWTEVNPLDITKKEQFYPTLYGTRYSPISGAKLREFSNCPIGYKPGPTDPRTVYGSWTALTMSAYATEILALTNPSVPHVSVPSFVGELKDLPLLLRGWGEVIMSPDRWKQFQRRMRDPERLPNFLLGPRSSPLYEQAASANLAWQWMVKPMISDLRKMWAFTDAVDQRLNELFNLREKRTVRKRCRLAQNRHVTGPTNVILHSEGTLINGTRTVVYTEEVWGTAHWKMAPDFYPDHWRAHNALFDKKRLMKVRLDQLGYKPLLQQAWDGTSGMTSHEVLATAWELTPWSWFIDWFSNVGDLIAMSNNTFDLVSSNLALMRKSSSRATYTVTEPLADSWVVFDKNAFHYESWVRKERYPVVAFNPFPLPSLPIINGRKWSILASLACLGALRP